MKGNGRFNIRVYGIWRHEEKILLSEEKIRGETVTKFPGGGLEYGEGTIDCLKREWQEEFGTGISVLEHVYTTDYFQPSFFDDSQVISVYYRVLPLVHADHIAALLPGHQLRWLDISRICATVFTLPIDAVVGDMLRKQWCG